MIDPSAPAAQARRQAARPAQTGAAEEHAAQLGRRFFWALFALSSLTLAGLWWMATGSQPVKSQADLLNDLGRISGLYGTYLILWQLVLMSRVPALEKAFGMERLVRYHRLNAYAAIGLISGHAVFQTAGYMLADGFGLVQQLADFIDHYPGLLMAIAALALLLLVTGLSIGAGRRRLSYETWYFIHLYAYLAVALAFSHELATGLDFIHNPVFTAYWWLLYALTAACLLGFRVGLPLIRYNRHRFKVQRIEKAANQVTSVYVTGRDLEAFEFRPGQFALWRFLDGRRWWEAHPFTLSAPPNGRFLRLSAKGIGDFSTRLANLRPGTPVLIEGPFGGFTLGAGHRASALLIAGGIGITPIRALAEQMGERGLDVVLLYRARRDKDVVFKEELDRLAQRYGIEVRYLISDKAPAHQKADAWLDAGSLGRLVPDLHEREIYICGPPEMTRHVLAELAGFELEQDQVHTEAFRF